ncbi:lipid kinase YegS [Shewanella sp. WXL01]|uniref:lipid kinase YegS n=1 Tax=Shewanella sp. WXL01 TaxID=2709721 RepID=UPI0014386298|nr:lipid kinase YegS [Shewanella sp. WXL01]NKF50325.1 lipid kinase YegS [Shewanella sp. WXL01]
MAVNAITLILNGKKAGLPQIREAVYAYRDQGIDVSVRVTWESQDMPRLIDEAIEQGANRLVIGGGDGSVNEAVTALLNSNYASHLESLPEVAILPLGTANDFATACEIPSTPMQALELAINGTATLVDVIKANERYCVNIAAAGFGAQVTAETPVELKNFLGGGAYTLTGLAKALGFKPYPGKINSEFGQHSGEIIVGAMCNGRQAGGGQVLAPNAYINDGLMDVTLLRGFSPVELPQVVEEIKSMKREANFCHHFQTSWLEFDFDMPLPLNLDGEPYPNKKVRFELIPQVLKLVVPQRCPCIKTQVV